LNVSLDLRCASGKYEGELSTPVGVYIVKDGGVSADQLHLQVEAGNDSVSVEVQFTVDTLRGRFASGTDSGPVDLHRTADAAKPTSTPAAGLTPEQWREDIRFLSHELPRRHANAFHHTTREQFDAAIASVTRQVDQLDRDQMYVALDRIVNSIGDAHTYVDFPPDSAHFPIDIGRFGDDYRVLAVGPGLENALGARVVRIDKTWVDQARQLALTLTPTPETDALADARATNFLSMGIILHGLGIISDRNSAQITLTKEQGEPFPVTVHAGPPDTAVDWIPLVKTPPLSRQRPDEDLWFVYLPDAQTLYCNFRGFRDLERNASALFAELKQQNPRKLVLDLRQNSGGDYTQGLKYLIDPIREHSTLNRKGHLFVLIGVNTFSAAMSNAAQFRARTAAMLVGEPIGERPNSYQEARQMQLPNSKLMVRYSTQYYKFVDGGENLIRPDQEIHTSWDDYRSGRDPVLDWVFAYK
jgi:hypothetical protein